MGQTRLRLLGLVAVALMLAAACGGSSPSTPAKTYKIGLVTDVGGLNDKSFNHLAYVGLQKAITDFKVQGVVKESKTGDDYVPSLTNFASTGYDLVIGVAADARDHVAAHLAQPDEADLHQSISLIRV